jgi:hypothetical protein
VEPVFLLFQAEQLLLRWVAMVAMDVQVLEL